MSRVVATYLQRRNLFFLLSRLRGGDRLGIRLLEWPGVLQPSSEETPPRGLACGRPLHSGVYRTAATEGVPEDDVVPLPKYTPRVGEDEQRKRARLLYQSRKRGTLETGLLLSSFAAVYLPTLTPQQLDSYDLLINKPSNDWQLYYWLTGKEEAPTEYCSDVLELLKQHTQNPNREKQ